MQHFGACSRQVKLCCSAKRACFSIVGPTCVQLGDDCTPVLCWLQASLAWGSSLPGPVARVKGAQGLHSGPPHPSPAAATLYLVHHTATLQRRRWRRETAWHVFSSSSASHCCC